MRHRGLQILMITIALGVAGYSLSRNYPFSVSAQNSGRQELTATFITRSYDAKGNERTQELATYAARKDGSTATIRKRFSKDHAGTPREITLVDLVDVDGRKMIGIDHFTKSISTEALSRSALLKYTAPVNPACADLPNVPGASVRVGPLGTIFGQRAVTLTVDSTVPGSGQRVRFEVWQAVDLDCLAIKTSAINTTTDGQQARVVMEMASLATGAPDPSYFVVPSTYSERAPSQVLAEADRLLGKTPACPECRAKANTLLDEAHAKRRGRR